LCAGSDRKSQRLSAPVSQAPRAQRQTPPSVQRLGGVHAGIALLSRPLVMSWQTPTGAASHRRQGSVQAVSQQTPSVQKPDPHSLPVVQVMPGGLVLAHAPSAPTQVMPLGQVAEPQQRPSTQNPLAHSRARAQTAPATRGAEQSPARQCAVAAQAASLSQLVAQVSPAHR
jgi:hypothetical protein